MPTFKLNNLITFFPHAAACGHEMKISKLTSRHSTNNIAFLVSGPLFILREDIASLSVSRCTNTVYVHTQFSHDRAHGRLVVSDFSHIPFHFFSTDFSRQFQITVPVSTFLYVRRESVLV
jgi:hypothetical protein